MEIRKRKSTVAPDRAQPPPRPVDSRYAAEVRQRAERLATPVESSGENRAWVRSYQRQQTEQQMANMRGEAVRARRLAEHVGDLSQDTAAYKQKRKHVMKDTTVVDPGHAQRQQRRTDGHSGSRGNKLNFNPLHPSMELPPEQLIRLLGMESKKIRKSRKARHATKPATSSSLKKVDARVDNTPPVKAKPQTKAKPRAKAKPQAKARPQTVRPADSSIQYERSEPSEVFGNGRSGLLVPSILVGAVAGIAISGYLFWYQPADTAIQKTPVPAVAKQSQKPQLVKRTPAPAAKREMSAQEKVEWQTSIEAQEQRLRTAAEQGLAERVWQLQQTPQQVEIPPAPVTYNWPELTPEPVVTPEPEYGAVSSADTSVMPETISASDNPASDEILEIELETLLPVENDSVLTSVTPADEPPVARANNALF